MEGEMEYSSGRTFVSATTFNTNNNGRTFVSTTSLSSNGHHSTANPEELIKNGRHGSSPTHKHGRHSASPTHSTISSLHSDSSSVFYEDPGTRGSNRGSPVHSTSSHSSPSSKKFRSKVDMYREKMARNEPLTKDMEQLILKGRSAL